MSRSTNALDVLARTFTRSQPGQSSQLALSIVTGVDTGRMRLNARKHGTRIISDRKAETRLALRTRLWRRMIVLCVTMCVTTGRSMCICRKVISLSSTVVRSPACQDASLKSTRRSGSAMWKRRDVVGGQKCAWTRWAPACGRQRKLIKRLSVYSGRARYTWTDWNWNTEVGLGACSNIMRITWATAVWKWEFLSV